MSIRTSVAGLLAIPLLFIGVTAISESAQQTEQTAVNASAESHDAYNMSTTVFNDVAQGGGEAIVWFGIAAVIIVAVGFLVAGGTGGR